MLITLPVTGYNAVLHKASLHALSDFLFLQWARFENEYIEK